MSWTRSSTLAVVRDGMWRLLLFAAAVWLAIGWSVLRLEPSNLPAVTGAVVLFGAVTEVLRACAGTRTWWLNAGLAGLFAATSVVLMTAPESPSTTPIALIGWYLLVRGTVDIAVATLTRDSDRVWGLLMVVGVLEAGLGFFAASPLSRTAGLAVTIVGALGLLRAVADLVTALRIREVRAARAKLPPVAPERAGGAGYAAGVTDYESEPARGRARHRAATSPLSSAVVPERDALATLWGRGEPPDRGVRPDREVRSDRAALSRIRSGSERWPGPASGIGSGSGSRQPESASANELGSGSLGGSAAVGELGSDSEPGSASQLGSNFRSEPTSQLGSDFPPGSASASQLESDSWTRSASADELGSASWAGSRSTSRPGSAFRSGSTTTAELGPASRPGSTSTSQLEPDSRPGSRSATAIGAASAAGLGAASAAGIRSGLGSSPAALAGSATVAGSPASGYGSGPDDSMWPGGPAAVLAAAAGGGTAADTVAGGITATGGMAAAGYVAAEGPGEPPDTFEDEWWRATADMDAMLALAGMTGAGVGAHLGGYRDDSVVSGTAESAGSPALVALRDDAHPAARDWWGRPAEPDGGLRILDQAEPDPDADRNETSIIASARRSD